jgi:hypothetical protein
MYASNLQGLLFDCSQRSDMSPETFPEFTERFSALRSYGNTASLIAVCARFADHDTYCYQALPRTSIRK